mgnify:CR=1 FL=1|tara:strand:+ start:348 stop:2558 length:2211 start_codon:yes stop_codon:yes gene_type:complete
MIYRKFKHFIFLVLTLSGVTYAENEDSSSFTHNSYGMTGLIAVPSARFQPDGELSFGLSSEKPYNRLYGSVQFFPWLEAVVRYTEGQYKAYNPGSPQTWKDKGIDFKFRLLEETGSLPALAVGFSDFAGTGAYASEYIVANKMIGNFDLTLGMGWGSLGERAHIDNPIGLIAENYKRRGGGFKGSSLGGTLRFGRFFTGESAAFFGGLEYFSPIPNLSLKLEYDSSMYSDAVGQCYDIRKCEEDVALDSPINIALNYGLTLSERDRVDFSLGFVRGNTVFARAVVHSNLNKGVGDKIRMGAEKLKKPTLKPYSQLNDQWKKYLREKIAWELGQKGFLLHGLTFNGNELQAEISQGGYPQPLAAIDMSSRILANNAPKNIDTITIINFDAGIESIRTSIPIEKLRQSVAQGALDESLIEFNNYSVLVPDATYVENDYAYPTFRWSVQPHMTGTLQHQIEFYFWQLEALINASVSFKKGLYLNTTYAQKIKNNFHKYTWHVPDGKLHHVRQNRRLYLTEGESGLRNLTLDYFFNISSNIKGRATAGYLEWMYGGVGGELLYTPDHMNWSLGIDAWRIRQRDYDQRFGFKEYETTTGFISFYYNIPFYDLRLATSYGKFLGKDVGFDVELSRRFETGARVGGKFSITDCDAACTGEGSFSKWVYFELPLDLFYINSAKRGRTGYSWSPLTKDQGQKLAVGSIYQLSNDIGQDFESIRRKPWSFTKILSGFGTSPSERVN